MRLALVADVHVANHKRWGGEVVGGLNRRAREVIASLAFASTCAAKLGCDALVVLGDLFDNIKPTPQLVAATANALVVGGVPVHVIVGNHDLASSHENDHALASLKRMLAINVVDEPKNHMVGGSQLVMIPYEAGIASEWLPAALARRVTMTSPPGHRVLLTHVGIWDDRTPPYLKEARDAVGLGQVRWLCDAHAIDAVFAGNWHAFQHWPLLPGGKAHVCIPGTLTPHGFGDGAGSGTLVVYDTSTRDVRCHVIPGPRFETFDGVSRFAEAIKPMAERSAGNPLWSHYAKVVVSRRNVFHAIELKTEAERVGIKCLVEVDDIEQDELAKEVRRAAVSSASNVLAEYAQVAEVKEPGTREGLLKRLEAYRKEAGA